MKSLLKIFLAVILSCTFCHGATFYPSGSEEIDAVRKEVKTTPTTPDNYRYRSLMLYVWLGSIQQQGADG